MATTWIKPIHRGASIAATLKNRTQYTKDHDKTEGGEYISAYECDVRTVDAEFLFSKTMYAQVTGRDQGKRDVVAYHIRQSFKPGEVTPKQALEIGYDLAMRWTKGKHQFIVAAHTNTNSPHTHIIFNSTDLSHSKKFRNFKWSSIALRKLSDQICLERGLSVIENPKSSKGFNRREYLGENKPSTVREQLRDLMDAAIPAGKDFDGFLAALVEAGVEIKRGKQLAFKLPSGKRFTRQDTLGDDYTVEAILERISGKRIVEPKQKSSAPIISPAESITKPSLLIDIQSKMQQGYSKGFEHWAALRNLKESAKTLVYLQEVGLDNYDDLVNAAVDSSVRFNEASAKIKVTDERLNAITALQKQISIYSKTRDTYAKYKASGWSQDFFERNRADITLHKAAKKYFDSLGYDRNNKLPSISTLKQEYAKLSAGKGKLYSEYKQLKQKMVELQTALRNVDTILGEPRQQTKTQGRDVQSL